jgi:hypothetical protein
MAAPKTSKSVIDNLPEVQRRKVVDALLAGQSLRQVSKIAGVSATQVNIYKRKVIMPAISKASQLQSFQPLPSDNSQLATQQTQIARDLVRVSPFRDRLELLWNRTEENLGKAEKAAEYGNAAKLLSVGHKNLELLGRVTGELESITTQVAVQIVMPGNSADDQAMSSDDFIEISAG